MRSVRRLLVVLVVLGLLLSGADFAARALMQSTVAAQLRVSQQLSATPEVSVAGFPFLTQAIRGTYDEIVVTSTGSVSTGSGTPQLQRVQAHLRGVSAPFSLFTGGVRSVRVASATATASLSYAELATSLRARVPQVKQLRLGDAGNGAIAVTAVVAALGVTLPVTTAAVLTLDGSHLRLAVDPNALTGQSATMRALLAQLLTVTLNVPHLPYGLTVTAVTPSPDGLEIAARAGSITLALG